VEEIDEQGFKWLYPKLMLPAIKVKTKNRMIKIGSNLMEYFLLNYINAVFESVIEEKEVYEPRGMTMDDFMLTIEFMPNYILPDYRRKRQYVNSVLAKNEINGNSPYNRFLFKRIQRGVYVLSPNMQLVY